MSWFDGLLTVFSLVFFVGGGGYAYWLKRKTEQQLGKKMTFKEFGEWNEVQRTQKGMDSTVRSLNNISRVMTT